MSTMVRFGRRWFPDTADSSAVVHTIGEGVDLGQAPLRTKVVAMK
jgi:hypothetical protein